MQLMRDHARTQTNNNNGKEDSKDKRIGPYVVTEKVIGKGTTAEVKLAYNMSCDPKTESAVKIVNKTVTRKRKEAKKEVKVLQNVEHENIIKLEHVEEDLQYIYIFLEYCELGDLYTYIEKHGTLEEGLARHLFVQIINAVEFCHRKLRICHHDIKLENLTITKDFSIKLIDFGFAIEMEANNAVKKLIKVYDSSPAYSALEILLKRPHDQSVDIFSMGVCLYYMLCGRFPFCHPDKTSLEELRQNVQDNSVDFPDGISMLAQDLIVRLLANQKSRIPLDEVRSHPWIIQYRG